MNIAYYIVKYLAKSAVGIYFRKIYVIGEDNIPSDGPVIICGNHSNQFIDPMMILKYSKRKVSFTMAATSYNKRTIGTCAKLIDAIPVNRPEDFKKKGSGKVIFINSKELRIINGDKEETKMFRNLNSIEIERKVYLVDKVEEDIIKLKEKVMDYEQIFEYDKALDYCFIPKIENKLLFQQVYEKLKDDGCICVFPEGTSHDRTDFIKLKAGIALFCLGAMCECDSKPIKIVPVGLNYFNRDKFRSEVVVEFSNPYEVPVELSELYKKNKREAVEILLAEIESKMKAVTLTAPSYQELRSILFVRKLYASPDRKLSEKAYSEFCKRFSKGYLKIKDMPETQSLMNQIKKYIDILENTGLMDHEVRRMDFSFSIILKKALYSLIFLLILLILCLPGIIIAYPFVLYLEKKAEKERLMAKAKNPNKIEALDVVSSVKIQYGAICLPIILIIWIFHSILFYKYYIHQTYLNFSYLTVGLSSLFVFPLYFYFVLVSLDLIGYYRQTLFSTFLYIIIPKMVKQLKEDRESLVEKIHIFIKNHIEEIDIKFKREFIIDEIDDIDETDAFITKSSVHRKNGKAVHDEIERLNTSSSFFD